MSDRLKLLIDRQDIEPGAWRQIEDTLAKPWVKQLAIMPDAARGYDLPIGAVALTEGVISPSFVGYDIGCGMCAMNTGLTVDELGLVTRDDRKRLFRLIKEHVPMGLGRGHSKPQDAPMFESAIGDKWLTNEINNLAKAQLGTLGSGNHFIEIGTNDFTGSVWITIHSGSRKVGHTLCEYYLGVCSLYGDNPREEKSYLSISSDLGQAYLADMNWAQEFASMNRMAMLHRICQCLAALTSEGFSPVFLDVMKRATINENHNHAEKPIGGMVLHRKGATPADKGQLGIIPGNMRDGVYITRGLGNREYLCSASHGAGRAMSRGKAKRELSLDTFRANMVDIVSDAGKPTLDEAPEAYKPIDWVIEKQDGVVIDVVSHISPIINLKG